ncbi:AMP-dependent synthetase/ligase [Rhodopseudomonas palustris]|uniref:AMP-dependent synthetase/ligase n=1 Tax=Rhodopseudomonas palustris TaxID=1076 RepID=UPI000E5BA514|nr:AMP-binding protein [Rhodopseudomonas palustris]QLH70401.1 AMP-binding protein [Rhodopseudomonas palustris]RHZ97134.1 long-chain fatty acid--CoA ligase [Rhodopseudomonas palustris]
MASGTDTTTLAGRVIAALRQHGDAVVLRWKRYGLWQPVSGRQFADRIEAIAAGLRAQGVGPGSVGAVMGDNCYEWVLADLAIGAAGGVSAGFDPHGDADDLARVLGDCKVSVLFVAGDDQLHKALGVRERCPSLRRIVAMHQQWDEGAGDPGVIPLSALEAAGRDGASGTAGREAVIIYTSGSTGPVRGAILGHDAVIVQAERAKQALGLRASDERLSLTPLHHVLERVVGIYASLLAGTVINFPESPDTALADLAELQPTIVQASPQLFARLHAGIMLAIGETTKFQRWACRIAFARGRGGSPLRLVTDPLVLAPIRRRLGLCRARLCLSSGAALRPDVADWFAALGRPLTDVYGHAEAGGAVRIADHHVMEWKLGDYDELWLRGDALFLGYAGDTAPATHRDGWWCSGDIARRDGAERYAIVGRLEDVLQRGGERVLPFAAEQALSASPYIADAFVYLDAAGRAVARVLLDSDHAVRYAQDRGIPFTHFQSLCQADEIRALVGEAIADVNRRHTAIRIEHFTLIERALRPGDAALAPSGTLRRHLLKGDDGDADTKRRSVAGAH